MAAQAASLCMSRQALKDRPVSARGGDLGKTFLTALAVCGLSLPSMAEYATVNIGLQLNDTSAADQAKVSLVRHSTPEDTIRGITNNLGVVSLVVPLDEGTSVSPNNYTANPRITTGLNPSFDRHHVHVPSDLSFQRGFVDAGVWNLSGQKVSDLSFIAFSDGIASYEWNAANLFAEGMYVARVGDASTKLLHVKGSGSSIPDVTGAIRSRLTPNTNLDTVVRKDSHQTVDDWVTTDFTVIIEPTADTDHPFNTEVDNISINSLEYLYLRLDLEPLTNMLFSGNVVGLETLGIGAQTSDLSGVTVRYYNWDNQIWGETTTDIDGHYELQANLGPIWLIDGHIVFSKPGYMTSAFPIETEYEPGANPFPVDNTIYMVPFADPHKLLMVKSSYYDAISNQNVNLNWDYFDDMWQVGLTLKDGIMPIMAYRDGVNGNETVSKYPVYLRASVSQWTRNNYLIPALGALADGDSTPPLSLQGLFGRFLGQVYTERDGLNAEELLTYNGYTTDFTISEGASVRIEDQNQCFMAFNPLNGHINSCGIEYSQDSPPPESVQKEILRGFGCDDVEFSPSIMEQSNALPLHHPSTFNDRIFIGIQFAVGSLTYGQGFVTPGTLYAIELAREEGY